MSRRCLSSGLVVLLLAAAAPHSSLLADVKLPAIFGDHMVLQQGQKNRVWGKAEPGEAVTVSIDQQKQTTKAGDDGRWQVMLSPLSVGGPHTLTVQGKNSVKFEDVLIGEVWICSGQSNMGWSVSQSNDPDLEIPQAKLPKVRLISVPQLGTQEPQDDFKGKWQVCSPETVGEFSGVGYFFGRILNQTLDVPVGLIDDAWGGSACEAWIRRDILAADAKYQPLLDRWSETERTFDLAKVDAAHKAAMETWKVAADKAKAEGKPAPQQPRHPGNPLTGNARPANIYNGVLKPTIGYGIKGAIWYQGESNAGRAYQYRDLFPLMIKSWRDEWGQGDFPFYYVQLADFKQEVTEPKESDWAELREAQTMTMDKLPKTGQAVITDLGEGKDIHPRNKQDVAKRLARWALANDYGVKIAFRSPQYQSLEKQGNKIILSFDHVGGGLRTFDVNEPKGFTIAGEDRKFVNAKAESTPDGKLAVWADTITEPASVRYAWADNPICNVYSKEGLPLTPFRTDDWPGITANNVK